MKRSTLLLALLVGLGTSVQSFAIGLIVVPEQEHWPIPPRPIPPPWPPPQPAPPRPIPPPRPYVFAPLEISYAKVMTRITDQVAVTKVDQEFYNPNPTRLEGTFIFPIPTGAQIDKFAMEIDGQQVQAELLPADKARRFYEDIVRSMRDPALLEYAGRDLFKVRIFPIEPNSRKRITLSYTQLLKAEDGLVSYTLPLNTERFSAQPIKSVSVKVELETKRPLKTIYSPSHAVEIKRDGSNRAVAGYEARDVTPDADFQIYFSAEKNELGVNLLTRRDAGEDGFFLLLAAPGVDAKDRKLVMKDVAFVLDTSGSMAGKKLEQAKKALQFCVENLNDGDRFEILRFSTEVEPLFDRLADATKANRERASQFIKELKPIGGTAIDEALKRALNLKAGKDVFQRVPSSDGKEGDAEERTPTDSGRPFVVIFLTDGRPTVGTTDEDQIVAAAKMAGGATRVFCFGIGTDVNTHLLDRITEETRAFSQYVLPDEDLEVKVSNFFAKIKEPVLANPTLTFNGGIRVTKAYPSPMPDLFKGEQLVIVGRYSGSGDAAAVIEGSVNGQPRRFAYDLKFTGDEGGNEFIPRLWATRRIGFLLDEIRLRGENAELRDEVTDLARKYGIVTPYTAYLILEDEGRRRVPVAMQSLPQLRADDVASNAAGEAFRKFKSETSGDVAIAGASSLMRMRYGLGPAQANADGVSEYRRSLGLEAAPLPASAAGNPSQNSAPERVMAYTQQNRVVAGRSFYQNGDQWIDSTIQAKSGVQRVRVRFNSTEYFDLIAKHPRITPWLALGRNVQFVLAGTIYEIHDT